jgi:enhancing lycopene biosynthesis protein 2
MKKIALILSGCGVKDGSEIHESVISMLAIDRAGAQYECLSINQNQLHVIDHLTDQVVSENRNILVESARIARGEIKDISQVKVKEYDAVILPGGFGAAKNLCSYAFQGEKMEVQEDLKRFLLEMANQSKPIGAICIAPVILARIFGNKAKVTIGNSEQDIKNIEAMGATHIKCEVDELCIDSQNKLVTVPAYMLAQSIKEISNGIEKLVDEVLKLA